MVLSMASLLNIFRAMLVIAPQNPVHIKYCRAGIVTIGATDGVVSLRVSLPDTYLKEVLELGESLLITSDSMEHALQDGQPTGRPPIEKPRGQVYVNGFAVACLTACLPEPLPVNTSKQAVSVNTDKLAQLIRAIDILRIGCTENVSKVKASSSVSLSGHVDDIEYVGMLNGIK